MLSSRSALFFGLAAFLLNPSLACGSAEPEYQYGEAELRAAVEGEWSLSITRGVEAPLQMTLRVAQRTEPLASMQTPAAQPTAVLRSAHACGTRTLLAMARACVDSSEMPLEVSFVAGEASFQTATLHGNFRVDSLVFDVGLLALTLGELQVLAQLDTQGNVSAATLQAPPQGSVALERVRP